MLTDWTVQLSSIGGMLSAVVASATYVSATSRRRHAHIKERADDIRRNLLEIVHSTQYIVESAGEGTALISAAASVSDHIKSRLSNAPSTAELQSLVSNSPLMLSACVTGWHNSKPASEFEKRVLDLSHLGDSVSGVLRLYAEILEVLVAAIRDGYSSMTFYRILDGIGQNATNDIDWTAAYPQVLNQLTVELQSGTAGYFMVRYKAAFEEIETFVRGLSQSVTKLPDEKLLELEQMRAHDYEVLSTRTKTIQSLLRSLSDFISLDEFAALSESVKKIEMQISKAHASENLVKNSPRQAA